MFTSTVVRVLTRILRDKRVYACSVYGSTRINPVPIRSFPFLYRNFTGVCVYVRWRALAVSRIGSYKGLCPQYCVSIYAIRIGRRFKIPIQASLLAITDPFRQPVSRVKCGKQTCKVSKPLSHSRKGRQRTTDAAQKSASG
jgi:hypothetical protein